MIKPKQAIGSHQPMYTIVTKAILKYLYLYPIEDVIMKENM